MNRIQAPGVLLIDKPLGITSHKAISIVKKTLGLSKIGHAGTLDPEASGLLICLLNSATRLAKYAESGKKTYSGEIQFGITTTTDDLAGEMLSQADNLPAFAQIESLAKKLVGKISQIPPQYSAIKVSGKRSYELARSGRKAELSAREIEVFSFTLSPMLEGRVSFVLECSKGTYVRSIARDLGEMLGCGAALASLRREASFPFNVNSASKLENVSAREILSVKSLFSDVEHFEIEESNLPYFRNGNESQINAVLKARGTNNSAPLAIYYEKKNLEQPLGLLHNSEGSWSIAVNF
ncbi:MAG: tRNA pseudouridine(55) synthase TruB [Deltaproteobacteria bacterium]|nr:tRNA pseudouridine(55) synthase TruB [Deltaproteobacteria bacterium]